MNLAEMPLADFLALPLPETMPDFKGRPEPMKYPKGETLARCGAVILIQTSKHAYAVVYGLEIRHRLSRNGAAEVFGSCCLHQAETAGLAII